MSTTNTYYIKSAADDTRAAMAKLESLVIGNEPATEEAENNQTSASDNEVATEAADAKPAAIQSTPLSVESGGGGRTRTYDLRVMSSEPPVADKQDKGLSSAEPGKVLQNPQPPRNQPPTVPSSDKLRSEGDL